MSCEVDFSDYSDDADPVEFFDSVVVKRSKKEHRCNECGETIPAGSAYERVSYRFEGEFVMERRCSSCHETAGEFQHHVFGGLLWMNFEEQWENGSTLQACLNRLSSASAKAHMQRRWLRWHKKRAEFRAEDKKPQAEWASPDSGRR